MFTELISSGPEWIVREETVTMMIKEHQERGGEAGPRRDRDALIKEADEILPREAGAQIRIGALRPIMMRLLK